MIRTARQERLLDVMRVHGIVGVTELSRQLGSSPATIRRDLAALESTGAVERVWGGARIVGEVEDDPFGEALAAHGDQKAHIARLAERLVPPDATLLLDIGTTVHHLAQRLRGRRLTVVTASLPVFEVLRDEADVRTVLLGGDYSPRYQCLGGSLTCEAVSRFSADLAIVGCSGVDARGQVRDNSDVQVQVKRAMVASAARTVVLADSSKFPGQGSEVALLPGQYDVLVTDRPVAPALADALAAHHTEVLLP